MSCTLACKHEQLRQCSVCEGDRRYALQIHSEGITTVPLICRTNACNAKPAFADSKCLSLGLFRSSSSQQRFLRVFQSISSFWYIVAQLIPTSPAWSRPQGGVSSVGVPQMRSRVSRLDNAGPTEISPVASRTPKQRQRWRGTGRHVGRCLGA